MRSFIWLLIVLAAFFASCHRRPFDGPCDTVVQIPLGTVWEKSEVDVKNVTVYFYDKADGKLIREHRFENTPRTIQSYVTLPFGEYKVVFHNEIREQIKYLSVRGYEQYATLEFYSQSDNQVQTRDPADNYIRQPEPLAVATVSDFVAVPDEENTCLVGVEPLQKNSYMDITVHVKGLNNARMPALADLRNIASGYLIALDQPSGQVSNIQFTIADPKYDEGSVTDGSISARVSLHGTLTDRNSIAGHTDHPVYLDILFMLKDKDKTLVRHVIDITHLIAFIPQTNGSVELNVLLSLAESLPNVLPEGSVDSGFGSDLEDWDSIDIPLEL